MNKINAFFDTLGTYFSENDKSAFLEIKEDMLQDIDVQLKDGMTEDEIIDNLGNPKEIADMYYAGINEDVLQRAKTSIIPTEELKEEYEVVKRKKRLARIKKGMAIGKLFLVGVFSVISIYTLLVFFYLLFITHTFLVSSLVITCLSITVVIYILKKQKNVGILTLILGITLLILGMTDNIFYRGKEVTQSYTIDITTLKTISLSLQQSTSTTLILIPVDDQSESKIEVNGNVENENKEGFSIEEEQSTLRVTSKRSLLVSPFSTKSNLSIYLYLPKETILEKFDLDLDTGDIQLFDIHSNNINVKMKNGQFNLSDVTSNEIDIDANDAEVSLKQFESDVVYKGNIASLILADGKGNVTVDAEEGIVKLASIESESVKIESDEAKSVIENSQIDKLSLNNISGTVIMENQKGKTNITNNSGKLVFRDNEGILNITNNSGNIVTVQNAAIQGKITNKTGTIKWVQDENHPVDFILKNGNNDIKHLIEDWSGATSSVNMTTPEDLVTITTQ